MGCRYTGVDAKTVQGSPLFKRNVEKYLPNDTRQLELQETITTDGGIDNIEYDALTNKIYGASIYRLSDAVKYRKELEKGTPKDPYWATAIEIDLDVQSLQYR